MELKCLGFGVSNYLDREIWTEARFLEGTGDSRGLVGPAGYFVQFFGGCLGQVSNRGPF